MRRNDDLRLIFHLGLEIDKKNRTLSTALPVGGIFIILEENHRE